MRSGAIKTTPAGEAIAAASAPLDIAEKQAGMQKDVKNPEPVIDEANLRPGNVSIKQDEKFEELIIKATKEGNYSKLESLIMIHLDALDGIATTVEIDKTKTKYPTGVALVRDATNSLPLQKRLAPDHPEILIENMLLRAVNTMRGIDYVLEKKGQHKEREKLKLRTLQLLAEIVAFKNQAKVLDKTKYVLELENIQTNFNTALIQTLHTSKLDEGLKTVKDYADLLQHYRDLASALDPAKSLITIFKDKREKDKKKIEITHTETSHPITKKTDKQKNVQLKLMTDEMSATTEPKNYHSAVKPAFKIANSAFSELIAKDDRRLSAQNKNTIGPTAKNPYTVNNEIVFAILPDTDNGKIEIKHSSFKSLRCGTPVYLGKHASDVQRTEYAVENLQQLATAAKEFAQADKVHITLVLTDSLLQDQHTVYAITNAARKNLGIEMSYVPINAEGTARLLEISPLIKSKPNCPSIHSNIGDKAARVAKARDIILLASENTVTHNDEKDLNKSDAKQVKMINLTICASGQDRTGTAQEVATQQWIADEYQRQIGIIFPQKNKERAIDDIAMMRALSGHNIVLATLAAPGSPGLKKDSLPGSYFSETVNALFYRTTAKTNKESHLDKTAVSLIQTQNLDTLINTDAKQDQALDLKNPNIAENLVTDNDIKWLSFRVRQIANHYKETHKTKKAHGDDIENLANSIESIANDAKTTNPIKLELIVKELNEKAWDKGIAKKINIGAQKESPSDQLITFLNNEKNQNDHSFYRQIGNLLQDIEIKFPALKSAVISRSQTHRQQLLSERLSYRTDLTVTQEDTEQLIKDISIIQKLNPANFMAFSTILELKFDFKTTYIELLSVLNTLWTIAVEKNASMFDFRDTRQQKSETLKAKINKNPHENALLQVIGTILQNAQLNKPAMNIRPKITGLKPHPMQIDAKVVNKQKL